MATAVHATGFSVLRRQSQQVARLKEVVERAGLGKEQPIPSLVKGAIKSATRLPKFSLLKPEQGSEAYGRRTSRDLLLVQPCTSDETRFDLFLSAAAPARYAAPQTRRTCTPEHTPQTSTPRCMPFPNPNPILHHYIPHMYTPHPYTPPPQTGR